MGWDSDGLGPNPWSEEEEQEEMYKVFNDSVHGHITLHPLCVRIINTPEFQRLRYIKQLSVADYVYPGASNNRFEHSLGVCYLAGKVVEVLIDNERRFWGKELEVRKEEKLMVEIAGLCHNLGLGPFSHTWRRVIKEWQPNTTWNHDDMSGRMLQYLIRTNNLANEFARYNLNTDTDVETIIGLIKGEAIRLQPDKQFLAEIVKNKNTGVDVNKWDYFLRDSLHLNIHITFDYERLLRTCTVIRELGGECRHIAYRDNTVFDLFEMYNCKAALYFKAYQHKVVKAVELMFIDAFKEAGDHYEIEFENRRVLLKNAHDPGNEDMYLRLTDYIQHEIQYSTNEELGTAKTILTNTAKRNLYTYLGRKRVSRDRSDEEKANINRTISQHRPHGCEIVISEVEIDIANESDSLRKVIFYRKQKRNETEPVPVRWNQIQGHLETFPFRLREDRYVDLLVFCRLPEDPHPHEEVRRIVGLID